MSEDAFGLEHGRFVFQPDTFDGLRAVIIDGYSDAIADTIDDAGDEFDAHASKAWFGGHPLRRQYALGARDACRAIARAMRESAPG